MVIFYVKKTYSYPRKFIVLNLC